MFCGTLRETPLLNSIGNVHLGSNPVGDEIFRTCLDRPWDPPSFVYNGYWVTFPGVMRPGLGVDYPPHLEPRIKEGYS
jgi:hypothetical protein